MELLPLHSRYENFFSFDTVEKIREYLTYKPDKTKKSDEISLPGKIDKELHLLFEEFNSYINGKDSPEKIEKKYHENLSECRDFFQFWITHNQRKNVTKWMNNVDEFIPVKSNLEMNRDYLTLINLIVLKQLLHKKSDHKKIKIIFDDLLISKPVTNILEKHLNGSSINQRIELIKVLLIYFINEITGETKKGKPASSGKQSAKPEKESILSEIKVLLDDDIVYNFIKVNVFEGITYFNKERFEELIRWIMLFDLIKSTSLTRSRTKEKRLNLNELNREINKSLKSNSDEFLKIVNDAETCGYDFNKFKNEIAETQSVKTKKAKKQK